MSDDHELDPRPGGYGIGDTSGSHNLERRRKKEAAREKLEEIQAVENPVERIKELAVFFRRGSGEHLTSELDMEKLLDAAQAKAFEEIRAKAEKQDDPRSYLSDVLFETDPELADDYRPWTVGGLIKTVRQKVEKLKEYHSTDRGNQQSPPTDQQKNRARQVLEATKGRDPSKYEGHGGFSKIERRVEHEMNSPPEEATTGENVRKGAKEAAERLGYDCSDGAQLVKSLREAKEEGEI